MAKRFLSNEDESVPMFEWRWVDFFTRVDYRTPLIIFVPIIVWLLYRSAFDFHTRVLYIVPLVLLGLVTWTVAEYHGHRFLFHWQPPGKLGARLHFIIHGVHHDYPRDSKRLVMPPAMSLTIAAAFTLAFRPLLGAEIFGPFAVGFAIGYLCYDMTHFALHHVKFKSKFWLDLQQHHLAHHYSDPTSGFGVSNKFWDLVYRTTIKRVKEPGA